MDRTKIPHLRLRLRGIAVVGKNVRRIRRVIGLTLHELAAGAHISVSTLHDIEQGEIREPGVYTTLAIAQALGVPISELFRELEPARPVRSVKKAA